MEQEYIKISELNNYIKSLLDKDIYLNKVYLKGEISNFKNHTRGHLYFTLKDDESRISAVMFQSSAVKLTFMPEDGMNVLVSGRISAYPAQGSYQIYVDKMEVDGLGALYIEYEKLKKKLATLGLFNKEHKVPIPKYPEKIGVITASTGAAVKDIMSTIKRRYPICEVILFPCLVQGKDAAPDIVRQIKRADEYGLDTIIVGRGGGSIEDLWAFNEEIVRAPTPTGAAEMAVPTVLDVNTLIDNYKIRLNKNIKNMVNTKFIKLRSLKNSFILKNPMSMYEVKEQKLDSLMDGLNKNIKLVLTDKENKLNKINMSIIFQNPYNLIKDKKIKFDLLLNTLKLVNPLGILEKGYSLTTINNKIIKNKDEVKINDIIDIRLHIGQIKAEVKEIK